MGSEDAVRDEGRIMRSSALVVQLPDSLALTDPRIAAKLESLGVSEEWFTRLLKGDFTPVSRPNAISVRTKDTRAVARDVIQHMVDVDGQLTEVSDCRLYPPAIQGGLELAMRLEGYEAVLGLAGSARLTIAGAIEQTKEGLWIPSGPKQLVEIGPNTLVILPAFTANGWSSMAERFHFRYIGSPPWSQENAVDLRK